MATAPGGTVCFQGEAATVFPAWISSAVGPQFGLVA